MSLSQKYEERVHKFPFLARYHIKAELYRYIYVVIFGKHPSELYWILASKLHNKFSLISVRNSNVPKYNVNITSSKNVNTSNK